MAEGFGENVRMARHELDMSVSELARACGMSRSAIAKIEQGGRERVIRKYARLAEALGKTLDELLPNDKSASAGAFEGQEPEDDDDVIPF